ncbi:MAG: hypothetical protein KDF67_13050, partial [Ottowia sp.]|nr:hypothetical protein [Ottowia sp.]
PPGNGWHLISLETALLAGWASSPLREVTAAIQAALGRGHGSGRHGAAGRSPRAKPTTPAATDPTQTRPAG